MAGGATQPTERQIQRKILEMAGRCFPHVFIHHSPNGVFLGSAKSKAIRGGAMKGDGTKAGFPDLLCIWSPAKLALLEVKRPKTGTVTDNQKAVHTRLEELRVPLAVVTSVDEAFEFLRGEGAPWSGIPA
jgi:hypothetical protein